MKRFLLIALLLISSASFAVTKVRFPAIIAAKNDESVVVFKKCYFIDRCETVGAAEGYDFKELNFSASGDRAIGTAIGVGEGLVGLGIGIAAAFLADYGGRSVLTQVSLIAVSTAGAIAIPTLLTDVLDPFYFFNKGKIKSRFFDRNNYLYDDVVVMEFSSEKKMEKGARIIERILEKKLDE